MSGTYQQEAPAEKKERSHEARDRDDSGLLRGLYLHLAVFAAVIAALFVINWVTRGADGGWWVVWPLQIWAGAWGLHLLAVALAFRSRRD